MTSVATGLGLSAAGMAAAYFFDPQRGRRRRGLVTDKFTSAAVRLPAAARTTAEDLANRAYGTWAETMNLFKSDDASDQVIEARVRSKMGRVISHPASVHVTSRDGNVVLEGMILREEMPALLACAKKVRGVNGVDNRLRAFGSRSNIPGLQGGRPRESQFEFMQENWSPAARLAGTMAGVSGLIYGFSRRDSLGLAAGLGGAALLARSLSNIETKRLIGVGGGRRAVDITKSINVDAPVDVVYTLWSNFDYFPQFMTNVLEVERLNGDLSRWTVRGPAGTTVEWDAEITRMVPNEMIAWKSVEGASVANAGYVLFEPMDNGGTEVTVRLSYNPPAGATGHAIAKVFGADPKSEMDADLMRMKSLIETGELPHDAVRKPDEAAAPAERPRANARGN
jgi:uncharacterized membrane protein